MAQHAEPDQLPDVGSSVPGVLPADVPSVMPSLQSHREVLPPQQPQAQALPAPQPNSENLPQAQILPAPQPQTQVLPTLQPHSGVMPALQPHISAAPNLPSFNPEYALHRFFNNPGGAGQSEVSADLANGLRYHQEHETALAAVRRQYPCLSEAAAIQEALPYEGTTLRQAAFRLSCIFRQREAPPLAATSAPEPAHVCVVCMDASKDWFCVPCGHLAMCGHALQRSNARRGAASYPRKRSSRSCRSIGHRICLACTAFTTPCTWLCLSDHHNVR